jgi:Holliday junction resolvasome RuvABC endonuclease subunit
MAQANLTLASADASAAAHFFRPALAAHDSGNLAVLALDLGTTTGWALRTTDSRIVSGTISFRPSRYDGGGMRYLRFRSWLGQMAIDAAPLKAVYFEEVRRHVGTDAAHLYGGFLATLTAWCETKSIAYQGVPVGTIKRHIAGKGNADKAAVIAAVRARGFNPSGDNEADAIAILLWALETAGGVR